MDLIYYDKVVDYDMERIKLEKRMERERSKLPDDSSRQEYDRWDGSASFTPAPPEVSGQDNIVTGGGDGPGDRPSVIVSAQSLPGDGGAGKDWPAAVPVSLTASIQVNGGYDGASTASGGSYLGGDVLAGGCP
jgi:hypothetical protein